MNVENFVVRAKRRLVEKYAKPEAWGELKLEAFAELAQEVAGLTSELEAEDEESKRFDLLMLNLQLAVLRVEPAFKRLSELVFGKAAKLVCPFHLNPRLARQAAEPDPAPGGVEVSPVFAV